MCNRNIWFGLECRKVRIRFIVVQANAESAILGLKDMHRLKIIPWSFLNILCTNPVSISADNRKMDPQGPRKPRVMWFKDFSMRERP